MTVSEMKSFLELISFTDRAPRCSRHFGLQLRLERVAVQSEWRLSLLTRTA